MAAKNTDFPQYRKLSNLKCFYEILNERHFREVQLIGSRAVVHDIRAEQYPEILRIMDMLAAHEPYELCEKATFDAYLSRT